MPPVDRNKPKRAASSDSRYSLMEFMREFPDDAACLEFLWRNRYSEDGEHAFCPAPSCKRQRPFKRYATTQQRQSWSCTACGHKLHPTAGTIYHKSSTSLHLWFYAMFLMTSTRCGISAKQLERELGVTYKTAWRMMNLIRNELMTQDTRALEGTVEVDETWVGGRPRLSDGVKGRGGSALFREKKTTVLGMVERGGRVRAEVIPFSGAGDIRPRVLEGVKAGSTLYSDGFQVYRTMGGTYDHAWVDHSAGVYVSGDVHTQTIEGFWSTLKNGIRGTYHAVSQKWLPSYLNEYVYRYNTREDETDPFLTLLVRAAHS